MYHPATDWSPLRSNDVTAEPGRVGEINMLDRMSDRQLTNLPIPPDTT